MVSEEILGVVLAGGASRRMGFDKRRIRIDGRPLVERAVAALGPNCVEVAISAQTGSSAPVPAPAPEDARMRTICDLRADSGPLAGLESALEDAAPLGRSVFLLACDLPFVTSDVVRYLLEKARAHPMSAAVVPSAGARRQPLCGLYRPAVLPTVKRHLESGRRAMHELFAEVEVTEIAIGAGERFFRADLFHNLNEPIDLVPLASEVVP